MEAGQSVAQGVYPTTIWSEVERAGRVDGEAGLAALEQVLRRYYPPLQAHLAYKFRVAQDQAADWLQAFIEKKVLMGEILMRADQERGKFRTFLLNSLDRFVLDQLRHSNRQSRVPQGGIGSLVELTAQAEPRVPASIEERFAHDWAYAIFEEALRRMQAECHANGRSDRWSVFKERVLDPVLNDVPPTPYEELVKRFAYRSPAEAGNVMITGKRMFHRFLREVVSEYSGEADVETELKELRRILAS